MKRHLFNRSKDIRRTILVADDEEINRQILKHNLGRFYDVIEAADGQEALEQIRQQDEYQKDRRQVSAHGAVLSWDRVRQGRPRRRAGQR